MIYVAAFFTVFFNFLIEFVLLFLGLSSVVDGIEANTLMILMMKKKVVSLHWEKAKIILKELVNFYFVIRQCLFC